MIWVVLYFAYLAGIPVTQHVTDRRLDEDGVFHWFIATVFWPVYLAVYLHDSVAVRLLPPGGEDVP